MLKELAEKAEGKVWKTHIGYHGYDVLSEDICVAQVDGKNNAEYIAAVNPTMVLEMIAEIKSLRQENARLNAEADWLAERCDEFCGNHNFCGECIMLVGPFKKDKCAGGAKIEYVGQEPKYLNWRAAAREAVRGIGDSVGERKWE